MSICRLACLDALSLIITGIVGPADQHAADQWQAIIGWENDANAGMHSLNGSVKMRSCGVTVSFCSCNANPLQSLTC